MRFFGISCENGSILNRSLITRLLREYRPDAEKLCSDFLITLESVIDKIVGSTGKFDQPKFSITLKKSQTTL